MQSETAGRGGRDGLEERAFTLEALRVAARENYQWPVDLRVFGALALFWSLYLLWRALVGDPFSSYIAPARALLGGNVFYGSQAQIALVVEAGVFWVIAMGMITGRKWSLLLSLFYMAETVVSYLVFIIAYMDIRAEWTHVRTAARLGPTLVLITLYLWIRSRDLIFDPARRLDHRR